MSGSGGGSSGTVVYPAYMSLIHGKWLDGGGTDTPEVSMVTVMNSALGNSPFASAVAFDPTGEIGYIDSTLASLLTYISNFNYASEYVIAKDLAATIYIQGTPVADIPVLDGVIAADLITPSGIIAADPVLTVSDQDINDDMGALDAILIEELEQRELPRFKAGMLNIGAVNTSSFVIGEAIMRGMKSRDVAKHGSALRIALNTQKREIDSRHFGQKRDLDSRDFLQKRDIDSRYFIQRREIESQHLLQKRDLTLRQFLEKREVDFKYYIHRQELIRNSCADMLGVLMKTGDLNINQAHMNVEGARIRALLGKEEKDEQLSIDEAEHKWDLEVFKYGANLLAAPSGGVAQGNDKKSRAVSALGGALSGAAMGAATGAAIGSGGGPYGAAAGAVIGIGMSFM